MSFLKENILKDLDDRLDKDHSTNIVGESRIGKRALSIIAATGLALAIGSGAVIAEPIHKSSIEPHAVQLISHTNVQRLTEEISDIIQDFYNNDSLIKNSEINYFTDFSEYHENSERKNIVQIDGPVDIKDYKAESFVEGDVCSIVVPNVISSESVSNYFSEEMIKMGNKSEKLMMFNSLHEIGHCLDNIHKASHEIGATSSALEEEAVADGFAIMMIQRDYYDGNIEAINSGEVEPISPFISDLAQFRSYFSEVELDFDHETTSVIYALMEDVIKAPSSLSELSNDELFEIVKSTCVEMNYELYSQVEKNVDLVNSGWFPESQYESKSFSESDFSNSESKSFDSKINNFLESHRGDQESSDHTDNSFFSM